MERLAAQMLQSMDSLVAAYEGRLQGVGGGEAGGWDARGDLAMVARCLETGDSTPLVAGVCEELAAGTPTGRLLRRLAALELTCIAQVEDVAKEVLAQEVLGAADASKTATFLWNALAQARMALFRPEPGESVRSIEEGWEAFQQQVKVTPEGYSPESTRVRVTPSRVPRAGTRVTAYRYDRAQAAGAFEVAPEGDRGGSALDGPAPDWHSAGVAPLGVWGETFGVLGVEVDPQNPLSPDDQALLNAVSQQVAQALESARLFDEEQRARLLLNMRVNELDCLNDIGRQIDQAPPIDELLQWVCTRLPAAMQFPERALVAIELEGRLYGVVDALGSPWQMVHNLQVAGGKGKICIAYSEPSEFLDEESALLGDVARRIAGYVENRRLFEQTEQALEETEVLLNVAEGVSRLDEQEMFEFVLRRCLDLLRLRQGGLLLLDADGTMATFRAFVRDGQLVEPGRKVPIVANSPTGMLIATRQPVIIEDVETSDLPFVARRTAAELGYRSLLLMPIMGAAKAAGTGTPDSRAEVVGALGVDSTEEVHRFTDREVALLQAVADQLSVALENRRLLRSMEEALAESQALYRAASMVAAFESLDSTLQAVTDSVAEALAADMVALYRLDMDERRVLDCFQGGTDREIADPLTFEELWAGLTGWVLKNQEPALSPKGTPDAREDEESRRRRAGHGHGSLIVVPIRYRGKVIGTLTAVNRLERDDFGESDVALMTGLANQAAAAIENVRLFDETQRRAEEQALLNEIGRGLAACQDVESVVAQIHAGVTQLLGVNSLYVTLYEAAQDEAAREVLGSARGHPEGTRGSAGAYRLALAVVDGEVVGSPAWLPFGTDSAIEYLIDTREPLLLRDRVSERLEELGVTARLVPEDERGSGSALEPCSAVGVPISMGDRVLGTIVAMSYVEPGALGEHHRDLLVALSNHAGLALQSVRLLEETRTALAEVEAAHRSYLRRGWEEHLQQNRMLGQSALLYDQGAIRRVQAAGASEAARGILGSAQGILGSARGILGSTRSLPSGAPLGLDTPGSGERGGEWTTITVPIILRGQKLGEIGVEVPTLPASPPVGEAEDGAVAPGYRSLSEGHPGTGPGTGWQWSEEDLALLEAVSEQLGQTLESARLFADTQRLAERERLIGEITARIRASTDMRDILETTAVELGRVLGTSRALVRLAPGGHEAASSEQQRPEGTRTPRGHPK